MILKLLLIIAVIAIVYFIFIKKKPLKSTHKHQQNSDASEMIECTECGVFVELNEAILSNAKYYCSNECIAKAR